MMKIIQVYIFLLVLIIILYWVTFIAKIGLHGDEAFFGLDAVKISNNGISRLYGMNKYTGKLQSILSLFFFKIFGIHVVTLRLGGIICNVISLSIVTVLLKKRLNFYSVLIFLLLIAQSILILCYSKIAWEVCSFNFLFISLALLSGHNLTSANKTVRSIMQFIFLMSTLLGAYNHIIFSSFIVAIVLGITLWLLFNDSKPTKEIINYFALASLSLVNIVIMYYLMNCRIDGLWHRLGNQLLIFPFILISIEIIISRKLLLLFEVTSHYLSKINLPKLIKIAIPILGIMLFTIIHSLKLFDILSNEVVLIRVFSYKLNSLIKLYFIFITISLVAFTLKSLITDIIRNSELPSSFIIFSYMGIFCLYTRSYSIRHFLILTILLFLYLSLKLALEKRGIRSFFICTLTISVILVQSILWCINFDNDRKVKAMKFEIGLYNHETSAHFLNFSPVLDFVHQNEIGIINTKDQFFIGNVFEFYKLSSPKIKSFDKSARINYDYKIENTGFMIE